MLDRLIIEFDTGLRTLLVQARSSRSHPDQGLIETLTAENDKQHAAALMRINHTGEVCAQALYSGQSLTARNVETASALRHAAEEETEHLAWCEKRIKELGSHTSVLNPLFYAGSFGLGMVAGALGDKWNLGFVAETEHQVGKHLEEHLELLPEQDNKSRAIIHQMQIDEAEHAANAIQHGGAELPTPIKSIMKVLSKIMTTTTYRI